MSPLARCWCPPAARGGTPRHRSTCRWGHGPLGKPTAWCPPFITELRGGGSDVRPVNNPLATVTASGNHHGLTVPPFITMNRTNNVPRSIDEPLAPLTTGRNHALTVPPDGAFYVKHYGGQADPKHMCKPVTAPLGTVTTQDHHALVVPYYRTGRSKTTAVPLDTVTTKDRFALVDIGIDIDDCRFRMLNPREHLRAQRFPDTYIVTGNKGEQTMQAGNAVSSNVAQWLGTAVAKALGGAA